MASFLTASSHNAFFGSFRTPPRHLKVLHADEHLRITSLGDSDLPNLFLCFTGVKQQMGGIDAEEFVGSTEMPGFSAIFVWDLSRTWFNGFAPESLLASSGLTPEENALSR